MRDLRNESAYASHPAATTVRAQRREILSTRRESLRRGAEVRGSDAASITPRAHLCPPPCSVYRRQSERLEAGPRSCGVRGEPVQQHLDLGRERNARVSMQTRL